MDINPVTRCHERATAGEKQKDGASRWAKVSKRATAFWISARNWNRPGGERRDSAVATVDGWIVSKDTVQCEKLRRSSFHGTKRSRKLRPQLAQRSYKEEYLSGSSQRCDARCFTIKDADECIEIRIFFQGFSR